MNSSSVTLSLIVPTTGREYHLIRLLESLKTQTNQSFEVIIVDQSTGPHRISQLLENYLPALRIKHLPQAARGAARARHAGVPLAIGTIIGWPDDDCWYESDTVENIIELFDSSPAISTVLGYPLTEAGTPYNRWLPRQPRQASVQDALNFGIEWALFITKKDYQLTGGFDQNIGPGSGSVWGAGESSDLCLRKLSLDNNIFFTPSIRVHHPQAREVAAKFHDKAARYAYSMGAVVRKNHLSLPNVILYGWTYVRALLWALLRLNLNDIRFQFNRLISVIRGYAAYPKDRRNIGII